jgi:excisionase family DNA binding protein
MPNTVKILKWDDAPDILKPQEAAKLMRIGKNKIYEVAATNGFPKLVMGERNILIPKEPLRQWIEKQASRA